VIGKENNDINPNKRRMIDTTVDKTGLSINLFSIILVCDTASVYEAVVFYFNFLGQRSALLSALFIVLSAAVPKRTSSLASFPAKNVEAL